MEQRVNWKKMYLTMAAAAENALALLPPVPETAAARRALERGLLAAEEVYIASCED